ncbi:hypothetical protein FQN54_001571 [Arachnomyces sp. PD_36]|nr:hypothetical protein FQN54_001571 [Arachnomyces sp. PD_36]
MLIDGEKYACEACVRGHRVSSCHHSDRPLSYVHKKGRPVTQCQHCRGGRKSKSTHVKCECGEKTHTKVECTAPGNKREQTSGGAVGEAICERLSEQAVDVVSDHDTVQNQCCCSHGERCTCCASKKKELSLNRVTKGGVSKAHCGLSGELKKPRLTTAKSEGALTVFKDGHHKPAHKHNDMAHRCGAPYKIPRSHTIHAPSELTHRFADRSPTQASIVGAELPHQDTITSAPQSGRRARSEHNSPSMGPITPQQSELGSGVTSLDLSPYPTQYATSISPMNGGYGMQGQLPDSYFTSPEPEFPMTTPLSAPPVDWASFGLSYGPDSFPTNYSQPPSYAGFDYSVGQPGLTTSSSGDVSDLEEFPTFPSTMGGQNNELQDVAIGDMSDTDQYRISSSSFIGIPQAEMLASGNLESIDIDSFLKSADPSAALQQQQFQASTMGMDAKAYSAPTSVPMAPAGNYAHGLPVPSPGEPMWASPAMVDPSAAQTMNVQEIDQWCLDYDSRNPSMEP